MKVVGIIVIIVLALVLGPAIFVWGINELLEQAGVSNQLPWNFWTWLAAVAVGGTLKAGTR